MWFETSTLLSFNIFNGNIYPEVDEGSIDDAKKGLQHVETKTGSTAKPVFKCAECGEVQNIPDEILGKMDNDESFETPSHHDKPMQISVQG